jgi:8-oxo-dGTP pyrophosphatase MutT (NUDIX family)
MEKSCGCIILKDDKVFLICTLDDGKEMFWSFPKGHQEAGETDVETALRETKEETGLDVEIIDYEPIKTGHLIHGGTVYKEILLFLAKPLNEDLVLQDGEVEKAEWAQIDDVLKFLNGYYLEAWNEAKARINS